MRTRKVILFAVSVALLLALGVAYHVKYGGHTEFMQGFWGTTRQGVRSAGRDDGMRPVDKGRLVSRYVDRPEAEMAAFFASPAYRDVSPELRRMRLVEFFTLKVADVDYMLLSDADKKLILDQFLRKYMME